MVPWARAMMAVSRTVAHLSGKRFFTQKGGTFVLDLLSSDALGIGFDSALFQISLNGLVIDSHPFTDLASAEAFFSNNLIGIPLLAGPNSVQIAFSETMSSTGGFSFDYAVAS